VRVDLEQRQAGLVGEASRRLELLGRKRGGVRRERDRPGTQDLVAHAGDQRRIDPAREGDQHRTHVAQHGA
jgi:hypothetical protein